LIENGNFNITTTSKAIKATKTILLNNGNYTIKTQYDDAIHSNNYVGISGGIYNINSGDDGIHSDQELIIDGGEINIALAYEGIESQAITINGGTIRLNSNDDGINAGGGADKSAFNRIKGGPFPKDENSTITINNGDIYINSAGDGIDSNGWIYFNGGKTIVDGPTFNTDEALDASIGMVINGGEVFGVGANVSMEPLSSSSTIYNISVYLDSVKPANTKITIKDSNQNIVAEHQAIKTINHIAVGTPEFHLGETYSIYLNDELYDSFTITDITTEIIGNGVYNERFWMRK
jgi:hypothetical protein